MPIFADEFKFLATSPQTSAINFDNRKVSLPELKTLVNHLNGNPAVVTLSLIANNISDTGASVLSALKYIKTLVLSHNDINANVLELIKNKNLQQLFLDRNNISDSTINEILKADLSQFNTLNLENNPCDEKLIAQVQAKCEEGGLRKLLKAT